MGGMHCVSRIALRAMRIAKRVVSRSTQHASRKREKERRGKRDGGKETGGGECRGGIKRRGRNAATDHGGVARWAHIICRLRWEVK